MARRIVASFLMIAAVSLWGAPAVAEDVSFTLENGGDETIDSIYIRQDGDTSWGLDRLADDTLPPGKRTHIDAPDSDGEECVKVEIKIVYEDSGSRLFKQRVCRDQTWVAD
ncbi:hypothetical protein FJY94_03835 [Candidatus Kaiserbacteria bacterium]|nr:hypothetical protein [Candidatus Kaiserbacteria bacterium]